MNETQTNMAIDEILEAFRYFKPEYQRDAVDAAIAHREEITPHLIEILEEIAVDPDTYYEDEDYFAPTYALMLLAHFKEIRAHKAIVGAVALPNSYAEGFFGDIITEDLPIILHRTHGGSLDLIKSLVRKYDADDYVRGAAMRALGFAVVDGQVKREEVSQFLASLLTGDEAEEGSSFWSFVVQELCDLHAMEAINVIEKAFQNDLVDPFFTSLDFVKEQFEKGLDEAVRHIRQDMARQDLDDIHGSMAWWACFQPQEKPKPLSAPSSFSIPVSRPPKSSMSKEFRDTNPPSSSNKRKQAKKKKRKAAKSSRKKNRRR